MAATRLINGLAGRAPRRSPVSRRVRLLAGPRTVAAGAAPAAFSAPAAAGRTAAPAATTCSLGANGTSVKHVIYIQFDNVHYTRDNPNVPSDLQQMPNLLNFITGNGTLVTREHTP